MWIDGVVGGKQVGCISKISAKVGNSFRIPDLKELPLVYGKECSLSQRVECLQECLLVDVAVFYFLSLNFCQLDDEFEKK